MRCRKDQQIRLWLVLGLAAVVVGIVARMRKRIENATGSRVPKAGGSVTQPEDQEKLPSAWAIVTVLCLPVSLGLMLEISRRFLSPGPDFVAFFATALSGVLTLSTVGALSKPVRRLVEGSLARIGRKWTRQEMWAAILSIVWLATLVVVFRLAIPAFARGYNERGVSLLRLGHMSDALVSLRRAASLDPDLAEAHYNLAYTFEQLADYDNAIAEYIVAIDKDSSLGAAYNNLGRLYIQQKQDYDGAIQILRQGQPRVGDDRAILTIYKNLGWAHYEKGLYGKAIEELQQSLEIQQHLEKRSPGEHLKLAETHRLLALVYEELDYKTQAIREWEHCLGYADLDDNREAEWAEEARQHLERLRSGGS